MKRKIGMKSSRKDRESERREKRTVRGRGDVEVAKKSTKTSARKKRKGRGEEEDGEKFWEYDYPFKMYFCANEKCRQKFCLKCSLRSS